MPRSISDTERTAADAAGHGWVTVALLGGLIAILTLSVYTQTFDFAFLNYDDPIYTTANQQVQKGLTLDSVMWAFTGATADTNYWAPLTWITFLIDYELYGLSPGGYHLTNVLFHLLNAVLLFAAFLRLTGRLSASFFLAAFFAVHPLHVESVAWVAERKDMVSTLFWMLTLWAYAGYVRKPGKAAYWSVFLLFCGCLMGKPMGVTLPFVLLLLDYWPLGRYGTQSPLSIQAFWRIFRRMVWEKIPLFVVVAVIVPLTYYAQNESGALNAMADTPLIFRIENVAVAYAANIWKTFYPMQLGMLYPYPESLPLWQPLGAAVLLIAVSGLTLKLLFRFPYLPVGWFWYLGTFVPVAGFVVIGPHVTADRYTYIPLIGLFIMVVWGAADLAAGGNIWKKSVCGLAISAVCLCAWLAHKQVGHWENDIKIYTHTLKVTRNNWPVHLNIGAAYRKLNQNTAALEHYRRALRIKPDVPELQLSVGEALVDMDKTAAAIEHYKTALQVIPDSAAIHTALAVALDKSGAPENALVYFQKALVIDSNFAAAHHGMGVTLYQLGHVDRAIEHYGKALHIDSDYAAAHNNLGIAMLSKGNLPQARKRFQAAISADPGYAEPHYALGVINLRSGDRQAASRHFRRALEIEPNHAAAQQGLRLAAEK